MMEYLNSEILKNDKLKGVYKMANKNINTRIIHKHDTETNWNKATNFIPMKGEIIVYDIDDTYNYERFKIGDGSTNVISLPFSSIDPNLPTEVDNKVDKVDGKGLSTNDYTTDEKTKLAGIEAGANKTIVDSALSDSSTNPVQNKVIKTYIDTALGSYITDIDTLIGGA